jgi:hypothetical protein
MFFNVSGYIVNINDDKLQLRIIEDDDLIKFQTNLNKIYKINDNININNKIYKFKINKKTKFIIKNYTYTNLNELKGIYVTISGYFKYYSFCFNTTMVNEINNELEDTKKYKTGYMNICNKIYN